MQVHKGRGISYSYREVGSIDVCAAGLSLFLQRGSLLLVDSGKTKRVERKRASVPEEVCQQAGQHSKKANDPKKLLALKSKYCSQVLLILIWN